MRDRRSFLISSATVVVAAAFPKTLLGQRRGGEVFTNASMAPYAQGLMNPESFENLIGDTFTLFVENEGIAYLRLEHVVDFNNPTPHDTANTPGKMTSTSRSVLIDPQTGSPLPPASPAVTLIRFALSFTLSGDAFPSGPYLADHGRLGRFVLSVENGAPGRASSTFCLFPPAGKAIILPRLR